MASGNEVRSIVEWYDIMMCVNTERRKKKTAGKSNSQGTTAPVEGPESDTGDRIRENIRSCLATKLQSEVGSVERARALG